MHTLTRVGSLYYIFGGESQPDGAVLDELWQLDVTGANWQAKTLEIPGIVWSKLSTTTPCGLKGHTATVLSD
jgi:hypothetical protein